MKLHSQSISVTAVRQWSGVCWFLAFFCVIGVRGWWCVMKRRLMYRGGAK